MNVCMVQCDRGEDTKVDPTSSQITHGHKHGNDSEIIARNEIERRFFIGTDPRLRRQVELLAMKQAKLLPIPNLVELNDASLKHIR